MGDCNRIHLIEPIEVFDCHNFEARSYLCLTDSGGIQEECPSYGVPVLVPVAGKLKVARGSIFSYYQFIRPLSEGRMTDREWRVDLGMELNDDMEYAANEDIEQPYWTQSYRKSYVYEQ